MPDEAIPGVEARLDQVAFQSGALEADAFEVLALTGHEAVSQLGEMEVHLALNGDVPLDAQKVQEVLHAPAAVGLGRSDAAQMPWFGVLRELELLAVAPHRRVLYRAVLVPSLWYLTQTVRSRVFQEMTVPEIVEQVLKGAGFVSGDHYALLLNGRYPKREHTVQYQESDYEFIARLCEHEGLFFFWDHASGTDKVVFADSNRAFQPTEGEQVAFDLRRDGRGDQQILVTLRHQVRIVPKKIVLRDSNYRTPVLALQADAVIDTDGIGVVSLYGDHFPTMAEGRRLATIRAEERAVHAQTHRAQGHAPGLRPGQTFTLVGHPAAEYDQEYVVLAAEHSVRQDIDEAEPFTTELEILPVSRPYRAPRITRTPRIYGLMHARIDGEADGTPAPLSDDGCYRVVLPFDEVATPGGRASRYVRRIQPYAGPAYGMHYPLHMGAEVLVAHVDGDPDRPVIVGAVPNPTTPSPVTRANATKSIVRTKANIVEEYEDDA